MGAVTSYIAARLAFFPPKPSTYKLVKDENTGRLSLSNIPLGENVDVNLLKTKRGQEIVAVYVSCSTAKLTLLYSHPNAADLGQVYSLLVALSATLEVNVLGYDYAGYGASAGTASEENTYADIEAAYDSLERLYGTKQEDVVLYGQSIGSGPTIDLAVRLPRLRGLILGGSFLSGLRVLFPMITQTYWFDIFANVDKIGHVKCPVLVIHGTDDRVVDIFQGRQLWYLCQIKYDPLWLLGGGHCNMEQYPEYMSHLLKFISSL